MPIFITQSSFYTTMLIRNICMFYKNLIQLNCSKELCVMRLNRIKLSNLNKDDKILSKFAQHTEKSFKIFINIGSND